MEKNRNKKLLVMYARYGSGHKSIAEYVANYIKEHNHNIDVSILDMTDYANKVGKFGVKVMDFVAKKRPEKIFDFFYELLDNRFTSIAHNKITYKSYDNEKLRKKLKSLNPDIIISTHFYCSSIVNKYNDLNIIKAKLFTIMTDYASHAIWIKNHKKETGFIVANETVKKQMVDSGVNKNKIYPFGLPLNINQIKKLDNKKDIRQRYKLDPNKKTYLVFGGSTAGSMYYYDYFKILAKQPINANIIYICGKNIKLKNKCDQFVNDNDIQNIRVLGYTNDVFNLLKVSDLVISKPGGATVTESLEMKIPMILIPGVGGQEKYNARFIQRKRYGIKVNGKWSFKKVLKIIEKNPNIINRMKNRLNRLDNNKSVELINDLISKM